LPQDAQQSMTALIYASRQKGNKTTVKSSHKGASSL